MAQLLRYGDAAVGVRFSEAHEFDPAQYADDGSAFNSSWTVSPGTPPVVSALITGPWRRRTRSRIGGNAELANHAGYFNTDQQTGFLCTVEYVPPGQERDAPDRLSCAVGAVGALVDFDPAELAGWSVCSIGRLPTDYRRHGGEWVVDEYVVDEGRFRLTYGHAAPQGGTTWANTTLEVRLVKPPGWRFEDQGNFRPGTIIPLRDVYRLLAEYGTRLDGVTFSTVGDVRFDGNRPLRGLHRTGIVSAGRLVYNADNEGRWRADQVHRFWDVPDGFVLVVCTVPDGCQLQVYGPVWVPPRSPSCPSCPVCGRRGSSAHAGCHGSDVAAALSAFALGEPCPTCHEVVPRGSVSHKRCETCRSRRAQTQANGGPPEWFRFGVEIETEGLYHGDKAKEVITKVGVRGWEAKLDGSLRGPVHKKTGVKQDAEVISPPLFFTPASLEAVRATVHRLRQAGARAGYRCGLHVHADCTNLTYKQLGSIAEWWWAAQPAVLAALPPGRDRAGFCAPWHASLVEMARAYVGDGNRDGFPSLNGGERYSVLNFMALSRHNTVEFRLFNGTVHAGKILAYITLAVNLVSKASRDVRGVAAPISRYGATRPEMLRLLDDLEITGKSARYHLLGAFATPDDRPDGKEAR